MLHPKLVSNIKQATYVFLSSLVLIPLRQKSHHDFLYERVDLRNQNMRRMMESKSFGRPRADAQRDVSLRTTGTIWTNTLRT
eukprot:4315355-Amphidinium_carterae.1